VVAAPTREELFAILESVKDPEVPVLSVVELGIVRDAVVDDRGVTITVTPTYSGCPAMRTIEEEIAAALAARDIGPVTIRTVYAPAWTTDWIGADARAKLEAYGIAPPGVVDTELVPLRRAEAVRCPYCGSRDTELRAEFGSTACKAMWVCRACTQPFEQFKAH
jgi:ring-1,2-phenylacetyl-CoA epoxidase subunit PaaD